MKRVVIMLITFLVLGIAPVFAADGACDLDVTLLNQDPYPAVPGDYVKLVFQVEGTDNPSCDDITFNLLEDYPISFDPGQSGLKTFKKVEYIKDYEANILVPYNVRLSENALDGTNPIEVRVQSKNDAALLKTFDLEVEDVRADFEVYVKNYDYSTHELTLEILNVESSDVEALTIEIPRQDNIKIKGPSKIVVGDLDSNEYTSADFEATLESGEFKVDLIYSDEINTRRTLEKTVVFESSYFENRKADQTSTGITTYLFYIILLGVIAYFGYKKFKKKKKK